MKFGISEVIHPLSTEKIIAENTLYMFGDIKHKVQKVSESIKVDDPSIPLAECMKAIKHLQAGNSMYTAIEFYTLGDGIVRMNICHMQQE